MRLNLFFPRTLHVSRDRKTISFFRPVISIFDDLLTENGRIKVLLTINRPILIILQQTSCLAVTLQSVNAIEFL
jgi:hypothetical protein